MFFHDLNTFKSCKCIPWLSTFVGHKMILFQAMWNEDLPLREQGYLSVIEFVSAMSNIRTERPNPKGDWLLFDASLPRAMLDGVYHCFFFYFASSLPSF